jgi:hypothetical protein
MRTIFVLLAALSMSVAAYAQVRKDGRKTEVPSGQWSTLRVTAAGSAYSVYFNGNKLYDVADSTFTGPGRVGVWTKADSVTQFDDLTVNAK